MTNKERILGWAKGISIVLVGIVAVLTSSSAWNYAAVSGENFPILLGILNIPIGGFSAYSLYKLLFKKEKKEESK